MFFLGFFSTLKLENQIYSENSILAVFLQVINHLLFVKPGLGPSFLAILHFKMQLLLTVYAHFLSFMAKMLPTVEESPNDGVTL